KVHENPNIDGFDTTVGAAPDWFKIKGTGGTFCQDDANFDFQVNGAKEPGCYRLTLNTTLGNGQPRTQACGADNTGHCKIENGASSYGDNTTLYLTVERLCNAGKADNAQYHISGHL